MPPLRHCAAYALEEIGASAQSGAGTLNKSACLTRIAEIRRVGGSWSCIDLLQTVAETSQLFEAIGRYSFIQNRQTETGDQPMRLLIATAIVISATIGLGGCFGHHQETVVVEPLKLG